ncbi:MAG: tRNA (guanine-N1)-methyltransferase [Marinilabilia sp.]
MKTIFPRIVLTAIILSFTSTSFGQDATLEEAPLPGQFDYIIEESSTYEEYRVVRTTWLYKLKSNVLDSLDQFQSRIDEGEVRIDSLREEIETLNQDLETVQEDLDQALASKNSISFLGSETPKSKYNSIMWGAVLILAGGLVFVFLLYKRSQQITRQTRERHEELEKEFDAHKKRALEKEKTMARQHLNELNKLRGRE